MAANLRAQRWGETIATKVDGELGALYGENGTCYGFNGTVTWISAMIGPPKRCSRMEEKPLRDFEVDPAPCEAQLYDLLAEFASDGVVEIRPT